MPHKARSPRPLGNIIQCTCKQRGLTQTDLANLPGMRQEMISKIETGHEGANETCARVGVYRDVDCCFYRLSKVEIGLLLIFAER